MPLGAGRNGRSLRLVGGSLKVVSEPLGFWMVTESLLSLSDRYGKLASDWRGL